jgi:hypothetical protein
MNTQFILARAAACLLLAMAGSHAYAQQAVPAAAAAAADPQAAVPATRYQSTLQVRPEAATDGSPDRNWVASNQKVAATNSMALTMKTGMAGMDMPASMGTSHPCARPATRHDQSGQGKMACCSSCPCMNKTKDAAQPARTPIRTPIITRRRMSLKTLALPLALALLAGCTAVAPDGGFAGVAAMARDRTAPSRALRATKPPRASWRMPCKPCWPSRSAWTMPSRWPCWRIPACRRATGRSASPRPTWPRPAAANPVLGFKRLPAAATSRSSARFTVNLVKLLTTPLAPAPGSARFEQVKLEVAREIEQHARDTRIAWVEAVAAARRWSTRARSTPPPRPAPNWPGAWRRPAT